MKRMLLSESLLFTLGLSYSFAFSQDIITQNSILSDQNLVSEGYDPGAFYIEAAPKVSEDITFDFKSVVHRFRDEENKLTFRKS